ncbi:PAS-domain containing protein [Primorskyibacter aestuariivivens]|uniref:PAS-domain containing protein n=1 Tax=Primorskyibacter aestuariivivens TaxID=1888912 RepID=UPI00230165FC|nr:PAS-domain containing protein [Primorskyibacter aestuariivivens]MDA7427643.1 PAS-domain containing protein [Primorskyibacter aestuariivivens]
MFDFVTGPEAAVLIVATLLGCLFTVSIVGWGKLHHQPSAATQSPSDASVSCLIANDEVLDMSPAAELLIGDTARADESGWETIRRTLGPRFGTLPDMPEDLFSGDTGPAVAIPARRTNDSGQLLFRRAGPNIRMSLLDKLPTELEQQVMSETRQELGILRNAIDRAPYPVWIVSADNEVTWSNRAYRSLVSRLVNNRQAPATAPLFVVDQSADDQAPVRVPLQTGDGSQRLWYEVISRPYRDGMVSFASNIDAVVNAEIAQRNFVQTLTKTFAQLSIGLAIFDRKQQLALFNPALIDLTVLPADFLSSRPDLLTFFDHLRDARIMPEPKNYTSWRDKMTELVEAARDGRYSETWNLPSGLTYRVHGKPHPDGAVAFLFEDISAEISLTRRFRADLELCHAILDRQKQAVAVFSQSGVLTFSNATFRDLWDWDPDGHLSETSLEDSRAIWEDRCSQPPGLQRLRDFVHGTSDHGAWSEKLQHNKLGPMTLRAERLPGGASMLTFDMAQQAELASPPPGA